MAFYVPLLEEPRPCSISRGRARGRSTNFSVAKVPENRRADDSIRLLNCAKCRFYRYIFSVILLEFGQRALGPLRGALSDSLLPSTQTKVIAAAAPTPIPFSNTVLGYHIGLTFKQKPERDGLTRSGNIQKEGFWCLVFAPSPALSRLFDAR